MAVNNFYNVRAGSSGEVIYFFPCLRKYLVLAGASLAALHKAVEKGDYRSSMGTYSWP